MHTSPTLKAIMRHWTVSFSPEDNPTMLPFDIQMFCAENDEKLMTLEKIAKHEEAYLMDGGRSADCSEAEAFRECVKISRDSLK